jgi:hypothetical protein
MSRLLSRRHLIIGSAGLAGAVVLTACGQPAAPTAKPAEPTKPAAAPTVAPTAAPAAKPTEAPKPAAEPTKPAAAAAAPTTASAAAVTPAAKPAAGKLIEIDYWHRIGGDGLKALEAHATEFNKQHEGKIKVTSINQGSIADLNKKVRASAAGGGLPGALMGDDYDITQYAFSKILAPLDPYINARTTASPKPNSTTSSRTSSTATSWPSTTTIPWPSRRASAASPPSGTSMP